MEVLRQLTLRQNELTGPTQEEFDAWSFTAQQHEQCIADMNMQLSYMTENMAQMESMQKLSHKALQELWKAVKGLQAPPEGRRSLYTSFAAI